MVGGRYLKFSEINDVFPEGTEIFVGINMIRQNGKWVQKNGFSKVQGFGKASKKTDKKLSESEMKKRQEIKDKVSNLNSMSLENSEEVF